MPMMPKFLPRVCRLSVFLWTLVVLTPAEAHISLVAPTKRYGEQKSGPCGLGSTDQRTGNVSTFAPGEVITVTWDETINHPSHYRIEFDDDGQDDFSDPVCVSGCNTNTPTFAPSTDPYVLLDNIADKVGGRYEVQVTLPSLSCSNCTLQLIQVMYDKPPQGSGNDMYYQCADLVLVAPGGDGVAPNTDAATTDATVSDSAIVGDSGTALDADAAATENDSGTTSDAGSDLGAAEDAGVALDAARETPMNAPDEVGALSGGGCAGQDVGSASSVLVFVLGVMAWWWRRRTVQRMKG